MAETEFRHIVRVVNTDLDGKKKIASALRKIKGISFSVANAVCIIANVAKDAKTGELTDEEINRLNETILNAPKKLPAWTLNRRKDYETGANKHIITSELDFSRQEDIKRLQRVKSYKGMRHAAGLPVRGQRTRSNFRRNKGKVMGVTKKKVAAQKSGGNKGDKK